MGVFLDTACVMPDAGVASGMGHLNMLSRA